MSQTVKPASMLRRCSACGAEIDGPGLEICPRCLLHAGLSTQEVDKDLKPLGKPPGSVNQRGLPGPGEHFGPYRMVRLLGQGGMGVVYEAEDIENGRRVALKLLSQGLDSPESRSRFLR